MIKPFRHISRVALLAAFVLTGHAFAQTTPGAGQGVGTITACGPGLIVSCDPPAAGDPPPVDTLNVVPLPPSVLMLGAGALGLALFARRRRQS